MFLTYMNFTSTFSQNVKLFLFVFFSAFHREISANTSRLLQIRSIWPRAIEIF